MKCFQVARSFYMRPNNRFDLGDCYELWTGIFQSTVLGSKPYLNVDIAHKAFPSPMNIIDVVKTFRNGDPTRELDRYAENDLRTILKGLTISYGLPGVPIKNYKFNDLKLPPGKLKFKTEERVEMTITQYMQSRKYTIRYPNMPCLHIGNTVRTIYVPAELCSISANQAVNKKCTETQTRNMIRVAATSTDIRKDKIMEMLRKINHNQSKCVQSFGIQLDQNFATIPARILDPPALEYGNKKPIYPSRGVWRADRLPFLYPKGADKWAILVMDNRNVYPNQVQDFGNNVSSLKFYNLPISTVIFVCFYFFFRL